MQAIYDPFGYSGKPSTVRINVTNLSTQGSVAMPVSMRTFIFADGFSTPIVSSAYYDLDYAARETKTITRGWQDLDKVIGQSGLLKVWVMTLDNKIVKSLDTPIDVKRFLRGGGDGQYVTFPSTRTPISISSAFSDVPESARWKVYHYEEPSMTWFATQWISGGWGYIPGLPLLTGLEPGKTYAVFVSQDTAISW